MDSHPNADLNTKTRHSPGIADGFGNVVDPAVGYARGSILVSSNEETRKNLQADARIRDRVDRLGDDSIYVFTGMACDFPLEEGDLAALAQESVGPALFGAELRSRALAHMGGRETDDAAVFNRTSGGIVSCCLALCSSGDTLISFVPGAISHPSVKRGAALADTTLLEISELEQLKRALHETVGSLVIVTGVTSEQVVIREADLVGALRMVRESGRISLVDDAYGARVRTVLFGQPAARVAGADLAITSNQKAGLTGPRAGLLVGESRLVQRILSVATGHGQEARAPIALGVLRSLERYHPRRLLADVDVGNELYTAMSDAFGVDRVSSSALGPIIDQDDVLHIALQRGGGRRVPGSIVPAEASAALGMLLLQHHGVLTVNVAGAPGSRASLRLKASSEDMARFGGADAVVAALQDSFDRLAQVIEDPSSMRDLILGRAR